MPIVKVFYSNDMTANFSYENETNDWALSPDLPIWVSYFYKLFDIIIHLEMELNWFLSLLF
jgi:hypothetical protein